jgi:hypothetical protein
VDISGHTGGLRSAVKMMTMMMMVTDSL